MYDACEITFHQKCPLKMGGEMIWSLQKPRGQLGRELFPCLWKRRRGLPIACTREVQYKPNTVNERNIYLWRDQKRRQTNMTILQ
jgi:hypothetical protein